MKILRYAYHRLENANASNKMDQLFVRFSTEGQGMIHIKQNYLVRVFI